MVIDGREITELEFNDPSSFGNENNSVFHPEAGGAVFQKAPGDIMADGDEGDWFYNLEFEIPSIVISSDDNTVTGNDLIAFLPGVTLSVCQRINVEAGIADSPSEAPPVVASTLGAGGVGNYNYNMDDSYTTPITRDVTLTTSSNEIDGYAFGCFENVASSGDYVYYHVLNER